jgi:hypothetical protein
VIIKDAVNIVDFIEVTGGEGAEFYRVGEFIKGIYDRLTSGVALIALQKRPHQDLARGGLGSLEKARLYLAIGEGKIKIVKGKNWVDTQLNPNGLEVLFKLVDGCKFIKISDWSKPVEVPSLYNETPNQFKFGRRKLGKDDLVKDFERRLGGV